MVKFVDVLIINILDDFFPECLLCHDEYRVFVLFLSPRADCFHCLEWVRVLISSCCWFSGFICGLRRVYPWVRAIEGFVVFFGNCEAEVSQCVGLV